MLLKVLDSDCSKFLKLEKLFSSKESIGLLSQLCLKSILKKCDNNNNYHNNNNNNDNFNIIKEKEGGIVLNEKEKEREREKEKMKMNDRNEITGSRGNTGDQILAVRQGEYDKSNITNIVSNTQSGNLSVLPSSSLSSSSSSSSSSSTSSSSTFVTATTEVPSSSSLSKSSHLSNDIDRKVVKDKNYSNSSSNHNNSSNNNNNNNNIIINNKIEIPLLKLSEISLPEDEATEQRNATLVHNSFQIIKKLSFLSPYVLFDNYNFLLNLQSMIPICLLNCENSNNKHILQTNLLPFSNYSVHQKAIVTMEIAYRNANQLKLLCEIIIQYCRSYPADSNTNLFEKENDNKVNINESIKKYNITNTKIKDGNTNSNINNIHTIELFEKMFFSLLPVLAMKTCIIDFTFLSDFLKFEIPILCSSPSAKKEILRKAFDLIAGKKASMALKVKIIQVRILCANIYFFI